MRKCHLRMPLAISYPSVEIDLAERIGGKSHA